MNKIRTWRYKNTSLLIMSIVVLFAFLNTDIVDTLIHKISSYGYLGVFIAGMFFVFTFTFAPALVVILHFAENLNPFLVALCAGTGGVLADLLIFHFLRDGVSAEIQPLIARYKASPIFALFSTKYFVWLTPILGAIIVASPLPDELGIGLMGFSRIKTWQFICLTFFLNIFGLFALIAATQYFIT